MWRGFAGCHRHYEAAGLLLVATVGILQAAVTAPVVFSIKRSR